jgi:hypothetical protein
MKIANHFRAAGFLFSVIVQYNGPDPIRWMLIYGAACLCCVLFIPGKYIWPLFAVMTMLAAIPAAVMIPQVAGKAAFGELFEAFEIRDARVEAAREMGGLLIAAAWLLVLTIVSCPDGAISLVHKPIALHTSC